MRTVVFIQCALHLHEFVAKEDCVGTNKKSCLWEHGYIDVMVVSTLLRFFKASPRRSSALQREETSGLLPLSLMGRMRDRMLNPVLSLALANDLISCIWSIPCANSLLLSVLRLLGQQK